jgi:hypothetical protein
VSHVPAPLARRIDRLARRAHRFHRFAHHPLCGAYAGELIALGRETRVCRGCALVAAGAAVGLVAGSARAAATWRPSAVLMLLSSAMLVCAVGAARWKLRPSKMATRFLPSLLGGAAVGQAMRAGVVPFALVVGYACLAVGAFVFTYRRRGPDRTPCATCPERVVARPCSGLLPIVRRERAFRRLSGRWLSGL